MDSNEDLRNYFKGENFMVFFGAREVRCEKSKIRCSTDKGIED